MRYICSLPNPKTEGTPRDCFYSDDAEGHALAEAWAKREDAPGRGVYDCVGVLQADARSRRKETVAELPLLVCDLDLKNIEESREAVLTCLRQFPLPPSEIRDSGHGIHAVWKLKEAVSDEAGLSQAEAIMKRLANLLAGDPAPTHRAALIRRPGTHNTKGGDRRLCSVIERREAAYDLFEFEDVLDDRPLLTPKPATNGHTRQAHTFQTGSGHLDIVAALAGMQPTGDSVNDIQPRIILSLLQKNVPPDVVIALVTEATMQMAQRNGLGWTHEIEKGEVTKRVRSSLGLLGREHWTPKTDGKSAPPQLKIVKPLSSFTTLRTRIFPPIKFIVPKYIAEGCTLIAGNPKIGKSWMALEISLAVASGGTCLGGIECKPGNVLYLALEDNERRLQSRATKLLGYAREWPDLEYHTTWPRADDGGLESVAEWIRSAPNPRLVVIDVLTKFRSPPKRKDMSPYEADYHALEEVQMLSLETSVGILVFHHCRKGASESGDPFERISGTYGLTGACDTAFVLDRSGQGTTLAGRGRDVDEIESAVQFDRETCRWTVLGEAAEVHRSDERKIILAALRDATEPMSPRDIMAATELTNRNALDILLHKMTKAGEIEKVGRGSYTVPPERSERWKD
jgi:hypothetical protein